MVTLPVIEPMKLFAVADPFDHRDWIFEVKHDGFRSLAYLENGQCRLISRRRNVYESFDVLRKSLGQLKVDNAILDGELVCLIRTVTANSMSFSTATPNLFFTPSI